MYGAKSKKYRTYLEPPNMDAHRMSSSVNRLTDTDALRHPSL